MTYKLSDEEIEAFSSVIESIPDDIPYVVLRNYHDLPESVPGADIDIFTHYPNKLEEKFLNAGFQRGGPKKSQSNHLINLIKKGASRPISAIKLAVNSPLQLLSIWKVSRSGDYQLVTGSEGYEVNRIHYNTLKVDFINHLANKSPSNGKFYRLKPEVEAQMINNRQKHNDFFTPHPIDELAHMICRGTFDHNGEFRDYYVDRCDKLYNEIDNKSRLEKLLELIFYDAAEVVMECIEEGDYDQIKQQVKSYSNY